MLLSNVGKIIVFTAVVAALFSTAFGKGSFGYQRSSAGGYFRSTKGGYYSQRTRYYTTGMYWRSGYNYRGYRGAPARTQQGTLSSSALRDVLCKRDVRVDNSTANFGDTVTYNSTQNCYKELYAIPGDPGNKPINDLMLDRIQFKFRLDPFPTLDMRVFPDKDIVIPILNSSLRLRRLYLTDSPSKGPLNVTQDVDLSQITWQPCTLDDCDDNRTNVFGYPSSRFVDGGRVDTLAISGNSSSGLRILLRFWLSNDFDEDGAYNHVFLLPSLVKWDIGVTVVDMAAFTRAYGTSRRYAGVEAILSNPKNGPSSNIVPIPVKPNVQGIEYNPRKMNRVEIGSFTDQKDKRGGLLSWWSSSSNEFLCLDGTSSRCVHFLDWSNSSISAACPEGATSPSFCEDLLEPGFVGRSLRWTFAQPLEQDEQIYWYLNFGYWDPYQGEQPNAAISNFARSALLFVFLYMLL